MATKKVLACSHSRSLQLLARLDARTEFEILEHSLKGGGEAGRATGCTVPPPLWWDFKFATRIQFRLITTNHT